jgi:peptidyl-prolyl cis-trans isomerase D
MFDLFRSRDKAVRYLLGALLGLVAVSMVITLIPGFGMGSAPQEQVVAQIGRDSLTTREVQTTIQGALRGRQIPPEMVQFYVPQLIDQMITERAVAYQASQMGFKVTDEEVANAIRSMLTQYFPNGDITQQGYAQFLSSQGLTVDEFERNIRQNLLLLRLQNLALEGAIVTPSEVQEEYRRKNDKIKVQYVKYTPPKDLRSGVTVTPEEIRAYYNSQKAQFTTPEKRSLVLLIADEAKIGATVQVPEQELRAAYSSNIDQYRTPERVHVRHILIKTTDKSKEDVAKAEAKANDLLKQIRAGADFAKLAKENSDDPGSAQKGGDLDWVTRGQTVPNFENSAFSLKPNEISNVIKTEYGYHILQVLGKEQAKVKSFEEVKDQIAAERKRQAVFDRMQQVMDQARAELAKTPANAEQIATKYGLTIETVEKHGSGESIPEVGTSTEVENALTGLKQGEVSPVFQIGQNKLGVVEITQVFPSHPAELADVEKDIRERLTAQKTQQIANQKVKEATDKLKAGAAGGDLAALAKQVGGEVKTSDLFTSEGAAEGIGSASYLAEGFSKPVGSTVGPFTVGNDVFLAKVVEKQPADMSKLPAERESIVLALKRKHAQERKEMFEDGLMAELIKQGKVKKYQDTITRIVQGYRG